MCFQLGARSRADDVERRGLADVGAGRAPGEHPPGGDAGEACEGEQQDAGLIAGGNGVFVLWRGSCWVDGSEDMVEFGLVEGCAHDERSVWFADPDCHGLHGW